MLKWQSQLDWSNCRPGIGSLHGQTKCSEELMCCIKLRYIELIIEQPMSKYLKDDAIIYYPVEFNRLQGRQQRAVGPKGFNKMPNIRVALPKASYLKPLYTRWENLISVCTLKQSSGGTLCGSTNIKANWICLDPTGNAVQCTNIYWLNQSKWTFST